MPQATNITVNNGAPTPVSKTFTLMSPAAGDGAIAEWALKEGLSSQSFPKLTAMASRTAKGRNLKLKLRIPLVYNDPGTGLEVLYGHAEANYTYSLPANVPESLKPDFVAYATNIPATALVKAMIYDATSAT